MLNKFILGLSALLVLGASNAAFAYEAPENKIGDRYPFLEQQYRPTMNSVRQVKQPKQQILPQYMNEDSENKIADRFPLLEQPVASISVRARGASKTTANVKSLTIAEKAVFDRQSARAIF